MKYEYASDQWSSSNPGGKKRYGREFFNSLQKDPLSLQKPRNLLNMEIVKDKPDLNKTAQKQFDMSSGAKYIEACASDPQTSEDTASASVKPWASLSDSEKKKIDVSKMAMINFMELHHYSQGDVSHLLQYGPLQDTNKVLVPVSPIMLDVLTERNYHDKGEKNIIERIGSSRDVTLHLQIHLDELGEEEDNLVYAIAIVGSDHERERVKHELMETIETEDEKLRRPATLQKFQSRHLCKKYFVSKLDNLLNK